MAKKYTGPFITSSFHRVYLTATVNDIKSVLGEAQHSENSGEDKVNFGWEGITSAGIVFTVYDWKKYRSIGLDETLEWHIGGQNFLDTHDAMEELLRDIHAAKEEDKKLKLGIGDDEYNALNELNQINE